jgi:hypothetical protein
LEKMQKNYGEILTDTELKTENSIFQYLSKQTPAHSAEESSKDFSKYIREIPAPFDFAPLRQLIMESTKVWRELNSPVSSIPWITPEGAAARKYYDIEPVEIDENQNEQLLLSSPFRTVIREVGEIRLDEFNHHALKTVILEQGGELYVGIKRWAKTKPEEAWREGAGIELDPAELCLLAEHLNRAIQLIFLETKSPKSEVENR